MYDPLQIAGGRAIKYASMLTLDFRKRSIQESDPISKEEGLKINISVKKNHCVPTRNPYLKTDVFVIFGEGTEQYLETLENAVSQGILTKAGAWIYEVDEATGETKIVDGSKVGWQGKAKYREYCIANPEWFETLQSKVRGEYTQMAPEEIDTAKKEEEEIASEVSEDVIEEVNNSKKSKKTKKEE